MYTKRGKMPYKISKPTPAKRGKKFAKLVKAAPKTPVQKVRAELGSGGRFAALKQKLARKGAKNPAALAAFIGRKKYGQKKMTQLASAAKRRK